MLFRSNDTATTEIYTQFDTLSLHDTLPISRPDYQHFRGEPPQFTSLGGVVRGLGTLEPRSIIMFGLLILIATPVARVVMCIVGFLLEGDRLYVAISTVVLLILLYSLFLHG